MRAGKNGRLSAASSPGRATLTGATNRIPDRSPDKALRAAIRGGSKSVSNVAAVLPKGDKLSLNSPPVALRLPELPTGYHIVARIRRYAPLSGEARNQSVG
ncbi:hypothetical protein CWM57_07690 [Klebsiella sp. G-Nf4]|nr:hypothetical protein CWM64_09515 [Klebsiella sp. I-Nf8]PJR64014.1 hypothetical protein CWM61_13315 [Klebsiella sp. K-Nf6]PJX34027.1 hypothetical protein CWM53_02100 [Klebsiella sp. A-Nf5]PJX35631.1 hypothetical protein CWM59_21050 [Klebsiella sp. B-Nf7]PJX49044.1 hypothetical protein CWM60_09510 [Klebsiella sp. C1-16S-Nf17]PJX70964.1 hypothetical protein CWM57_07690 [Klebsiella sp. G-Nf4]PJX75458.1 hypothetical protein CWM55_08760 [Klebsiella sp. G2-16S-Nf13]PKJ75298.1 hypothetical protei